MTQTVAMEKKAVLCRLLHYAHQFIKSEKREHAAVS